MYLHLSRSLGAPRTQGSPTPCTTCSYHPTCLDPLGPQGPRSPKHVFLLIASPPNVSIPRGPKGPGEPYSLYRLFVSPPPVSIPRCPGALNTCFSCSYYPHLSRSPGAHCKPTPCTNCSYHPHLSRSPGAPSSPTPLSLDRITPTCLDPQGP